MDSKIKSKRFKNFVKKPNVEERSILKNSEIPKEMVRRFPRILNSQKTYRGPQKFGLISYYLIPPEQRKVDDIEGLFILRADRWKTAEEAQMEAEKIIRERDSLNIYHVVKEEESYVLSNNHKYSQRDYKVNVNKTASEAAGAFNDSELDQGTQDMLDKQMVDMMESKEIAEEKIKVDEEKKEKEQYERIQRMRQTAERTDIEGTLEYYTKCRSKYNNMLVNIKEIYKQVPIMNDLKKSCEELLREINDMDDVNPHYRKQWKIKEEKELQDVGMKNVNLNTELLTPNQYCEEDFAVIRERENNSDSDSADEKVGMETKERKSPPPVPKKKRNRRKNKRVPKPEGYEELRSSEEFKE